MSIGPNSSLIRALCHGPLGTEARVIRRVSNEVLAAHSTHACMPSFTLSLSLSSYIDTYVYSKPESCDMIFMHRCMYIYIYIWIHDKCMRLCMLRVQNINQQRIDHSVVSIPRWYIYIHKHEHLATFITMYITR